MINCYTHSDNFELIKKKKKQLNFISFICTKYKYLKWHKHYYYNCINVKFDKIVYKKLFGDQYWSTHLYEWKKK